MLRIVAAGFTALFITASPLAYAQSPGTQNPAGISPADLSQLTNARIEIVKLALQLTPEQMKYWPAVEEAMRGRLQDRQARAAAVLETVGTTGAAGIAASIRDRDPVDFLNRRADALAERSADLKQLAAAWQPLYQTLTPDQKRRMGLLTVVVVRQMRDAIENGE